MSKTLLKFKGKEYRPMKQEQKRKLAKTKFMGWTSGQHSRGVYDHVIEDGRFFNIKTDRAPIKNVDFVKYGYPMTGTQHKSVIKNKAIMKELDCELKNFKN